MKLAWSILLLSVSFASSIVIDCQFKIRKLSGVGAVHYCDINSNSNLSITERDTVVTAVTGTILNENVMGFWSSSSSSTINYMPRLNDVFPNLVVILVHSARMREIRQSDLQPYPELKYLALYANLIETLEKDLFKYNPQLLNIDLQVNRIKRVHPSVFEQLNKLEYLGMAANECVKETAHNRTDVLHLITKIKSHCHNYDLVYEIESKLAKTSDQIQDQNESMKDLNEEIVKRIESSNSKIENLTKMIQDLAKNNSENEAKMAENFNKQLMASNLATQSKLDDLHVKFNGKFIEMTEKINKLEQHIVAIVDALLSVKEDTKQSPSLDTNVHDSSEEHRKIN
jgi:hypothetical protein